MKDINVDVKNKNNLFFSVNIMSEFVLLEHSAAYLMCNNGETYHFQFRMVEMGRGIAGLLDLCFSTARYLVWIWAATSDIKMLSHR